MAIVAKVLIILILCLHVYFLILETVLFKTRGRKVFGLSAETAEIMSKAMSNQGCYNGFLAMALAIGLLHQDPAVAHAFLLYGLGCVAVAGVWGALTVKTAILFVQTIPAVLALMLYNIARIPA
jgi:putative membrane protein